MWDRRNWGKQAQGQQQVVPHSNTPASSNPFSFNNLNMYTLKDFHKEYPDDDACLQEIFELCYGNLRFCPKCKKKTRFHRYKKIKAYTCQYCRYPISPLAGTLFHKSSTPLKKWFEAIFLLLATDNKISAKQLQRHFNVTYKTAWRMKDKITPLVKASS